MRPVTGAASSSDLSYPWKRAAVLAGLALSTGVGFAISPKLGLALATLTVVVMVVVFVTLFREGKRRRAAGYKPDFDALQARVLKRVKWGVLSLALLVGLTVLALLTHDDDKPVWPLVVSPVIVAFLLGWTWFTGRVLLPWAHRRQQRGDTRAES